MRFVIAEDLVSELVGGWSGVYGGPYLLLIDRTVRSVLVEYRTDIFEYGPILSRGPCKNRVKIFH